MAALIVQLIYAVLTVMHNCIECISNIVSNIVDCLFAYLVLTFVETY